MTAQPLRILVPLDTIDAAHPALLAALTLFPGAQLSLLHVLPTVSDRPTPAGAFAQAAAVLRERETEHLARAREDLAALDAGPGEVIASNDIPGEIVSRSREFDLVCLGTARKGRLERLFLGSVAQAVASSSHAPVVTVPMAWMPHPHRARALLLHDFSPAATGALAFLRRHLPGLEVELLHVVDPGALSAPIETPAARPGLVPGSRDLHERNRQWHRAAEAKLAELGGGVVLEGSPAALALARAADCALLALGRSSRGALERFFFGSTAQTIVRESPVPVLTVGSDWEPGS